MSHKASLQPWLQGRPAGYTINQLQLQVVGDDIKAPSPEEVITREATQKVVENILDMKTENRKKMALLKGKGHDEPHHACLGAEQNNLQVEELEGIPKEIR